MRAFAAALVLILCVAATPEAGAQVPIDRAAPVVMRADELVHDAKHGIVTATGSVEIAQGARILLADSVSYDERDDTVTASGNVALLEPTGEVLFADFVELGDEMKHDLTAPFVIDRAMNGRIFLTYVECCFVPTLAPGDIVVMDNLSAHKVEAVRQTIKQAGVKLLYLPPYSPDLKPIEQLFIKLKALLRKAARRSVEALWKTIGRLPERFPPHEWANYFKNAGYA